jgi:hypothetical protein
VSNIRSVAFDDEIYNTMPLDFTSLESTAECFPSLSELFLFLEVECMYARRAEASLKLDILACPVWHARPKSTIFLKAEFFSRLRIDT